MTAAPLLGLNAVLPQSRSHDSVALARAATGAGLDFLGFADSPRLYPDPFIECAESLRQSDLVSAGPCVANLTLRHPSVVAGALRTLHARFPGRVQAAVGRGESALRNEGIDPPSLTAYCAQLDALRDGLGQFDQPMRLLGAASGPRTIIATAQRVPGVLLDAGIDPVIVAKAVVLAREHLPAGGPVWCMARVLPTRTDDETRAARRALLGSCAARITASPAWYGLMSAADRVAVAEIATAHDYSRHGTAAAIGADFDGTAALLVDRLFLLIGPSPTIVDGLRALLAAGVDGVLLAGALPGLYERLDEVGRVWSAATAPSSRLVGR